MKIRTDFVTNSSSSSFIIVSKEPELKLPDYGPFWTYRFDKFEGESAIEIYGKLLDETYNLYLYCGSGDNRTCLKSVKEIQDRFGVSYKAAVLLAEVSIYNDTEHYDKFMQMYDELCEGVEKPYVFCETINNNHAYELEEILNTMENVKYHKEND